MSEKSGEKVKKVKKVKIIEYFAKVLFYANQLARQELFRGVGCYK